MVFPWAEWRPSCGGLALLGLAVSRLIGGRLSLQVGLVMRWDISFLDFTH